MSSRSKSIGVTTVRDWAKALPPGGSVLDLGCGHGMPISKALIDEGLAFHGIDAWPSLIAALRLRFPAAPVECGAVEDSRFFDRQFEGIVVWGLDVPSCAGRSGSPDSQGRAGIEAVGGFLFTAPHQACEWLDNLTGRKSRSIGSGMYRSLVEAEGLPWLAKPGMKGRTATTSFASRAARTVRSDNPSKRARVSRRAA